MQPFFNIDFIQSEIKKRNMSNTEFAHACGVSYGTLKKILSDNIHIRTTSAVKIADYLNIRMDDLRFISSEATPKKHSHN